MAPSAGPPHDTRHRDHGGAGLEVFRFVTAEKVDLYLAILGVVFEAKARYRIQLRVEDVARELADSTEEDLTTALDQLTTWGNLKRTQDTRDVSTLAEFHRRRSLYQLTPRGEEAHKGVLAVQRVADTSGRLSMVMLPAICERLEALGWEMAQPRPDAARLYSLLKELHDYSTELADNARRFLNNLSDVLSDLSLNDETFIAYKRAVLSYLDRFILVLTRRLPQILDGIGRLEQLGTQRMITLAASADEAPTPDGQGGGPLQMLRQRWDGFRAWFLGSPGARAVVEDLRAAAVGAIDRILQVLEHLNEQRFRQVNRRADLLQLARWFCGAGTDEEAHALFVDAFGLFGARHFTTPGRDEELERGKSFGDAEPVEVSPRLRQAGRRANPGRPAAIADYSLGKRLGLERIRQQDAQTEAAAARFLKRPLRVSELGRLSRQEFFLFLELVDAALRGAVGPRRPRRATTASGRFGVLLTPPADGAEADIETGAGRLRCPDFLVEVTAHDAPPGGPVRQAS